MKKQYGSAKGEEVFYASRNAGNITGVDAVDAGAGVLLTHGDRALFLKRSDKAGDHVGEWCCPGGSVENGETPEEAARRETAEETGLAGLLSGDLTRIDEGEGFVTFRQAVGEEPEPTLDDEHTEFKWAAMADPPQPLHPGVAATLKKLLGGAAQDRREYDDNGWFEVLDNPISSAGVYEYSEATVVDGGDPRKLVSVFRPPEELDNPETIKSFRLMPWTDDHPSTLLGSEAKGLVPAERKGVHGVIGEQVYFKHPTLYGNLKVFSESLKGKIPSKRELSCGYHCQFVPQEGVYEGKPYQYVQRNIRGNHVSSVLAGRMGSGVRVLDAAESSRCEYFTFALDLKESIVREDEKAGALDADTLKFIEDSFGSLVGELEKKGYSKVYATKVAGKVAAEKGMTGHDSTPTGDTKVADKTEAELKKEAEDRRAARDAKRGARDSMRAKDGMNEEQEAAEDAAECAEDAEEEKEDEKAEGKEARDRRSARDRRAGARDARKSARDRAAKDAKDAKDAADAKAAADAAKGKGMDAAEVNALIDAKVNERVAAIGPTLRREEAAKNTLYARLSPIVGAFDHAEMTLPAMASYGLKKLGVTAEAADPVTALDFYLTGRAQVAAPQLQALDAASLGGSEPAFLHAYLNS
jgi:8-oxo-dGTP pyrophosphatase MutT (NUDIX family)